MDSYIGPNLDVWFHPDFLSKKEADDLLTFLEENVRWKSKYKRWRQDFGNPGVAYSVTIRGRTKVRPTVDWTNIPELLAIKEKVEKATGEKFTYCVVQKYPTGNIGIDPHRDKEMIKGSVIAGLSVGSGRDLILSPPRWLDYDPVRIHLPHGSLYALNPPTNDYWSHSIPRDNKVKSARISLTFRRL